MQLDKLAFFDFDGTLVDFDTVNPFIRYVLSRHPEKDVEPDKSLPHKQYRLKLLSGLDAQELDVLAADYYKTKVRPFLVRETVERLGLLQSHGYEVFVVSGSYDLYLRYFCQEMGVGHLICTEVAFSNSDGSTSSLLEMDEATVSYEGYSCSGAFKSLDCMRENKLVLLEERMGRSDYRGIESIAFSDSETDLPLLRACKRGVVVAPKKSDTISWAEENGFDTLVYRYPLRRKLYRKICYYGRKCLRISS